jgi:hypothetical protein
MYTHIYMYTRTHTYVYVRRTRRDVIFCVIDDTDNTTYHEVSHTHIRTRTYIIRMHTDIYVYTYVRRTHAWRDGYINIHGTTIYQYFTHSYASSSPSPLDTC